MLLRSLAAAALALPALGLHSLGAPAAETTYRVQVSGMHATSNDRVAGIAAVQPLPPKPLDGGVVRVTAGGASVSTTVTPVLSAQTAVSIVVDASAAGADSLRRSGLSGVTNLLLQLPPQSPTSVIADRQPPAIVAPAGPGVADDLDALGELSSSGQRATADAIALALRQLPPAGAANSVLVLYTGARDAGGPAAVALGQQLRQAHVVLAVVDASPDSKYWQQVSTITGGLDLHPQNGAAIAAFDTLADALHARYELTFPRPTGPVTQVDMQFTVAGQQVSTSVPLPARVSAPAEDRDSGVTSLWWLIVAVFAGLVVGALAVAVRRRRSAPPPVWRGADWSAGKPNPPTPQPLAGSAATLDPDREGSPPHGVRIFDVAGTQTPREITNILFEPRSVRDAREHGDSEDAQDEAAGDAQQEEVQQEEVQNEEVQQEEVQQEEAQQEEAQNEEAQNEEAQEPEGPRWPETPRWPATTRKSGAEHD